MFDHQTVVYEFASGVRLYALCQTRAGCYPNWDDVIMGSKGVCHWTACKINGQTKWKYQGPQNDPNIGEQERLIGAIRSGNHINDGGWMINSTLMAIMGQIACYSGTPVTWEQMLAADFEFEPKIADVTLDMPAYQTGQTGPHGQLSAACARDYEVSVELLPASVINGRAPTGDLPV